MVTVSTIAKVRLASFVQERKITAISRELRLAWNKERIVRDEDSAETGGAMCGVPSHCRNQVRSWQHWMECFQLMSADPNSNG